MTLPVPLALAAALAVAASLAACAGDDAPAPVDGGVDLAPAPDAGPDDAELTVTTPGLFFAALFDGNLVAADYWAEEPAILSAGVGFADIVGLPFGTLNEENVWQAGGAWSTAFGCDDTRNTTSASTQANVALAYINQTPYAGLRDDALGLDGLPVVFSWPMDTRTLSLTDFRLTLSTGEVVTPQAVSPFPNLENNERNTAVLFGEFANRLPSTDPEARFPVRVEIVADDTPLTLVGPEGRTESAVGLAWETTTSPYDPDNGPRLVGAKLNRVGERVLGEGLSVPAPAQVVVPNDELLLYDEGDFRLRVLTSGGFSPDGVRGVLPTDFETFFRLHARGVDGRDVVLDEAGVEVEVLGGRLRVVGLADLGPPEGDGVVYDGCYDEDLDNYIDIILVGDDAAARNLTHVEIPSLAGGYGAFFNPGGPGTTPFDGAAYTSPGPPDLEPVLIALDDPMRVTRMAR